jgi:hypothetical protein
MRYALRAGPRSSYSDCRGTTKGKEGLRAKTSPPIKRPRTIITMRTTSQIFFKLIPPAGILHPNGSIEQAFLKKGTSQGGKNICSWNIKRKGQSIPYFREEAGWQNF